GPAGDAQAHLEGGGVADGQHLVGLGDVLTVDRDDAPAGAEGGRPADAAAVDGDGLGAGVAQLLHQVEEELELEGALGVGDAHGHPRPPGGDHPGQDLEVGQLAGGGVAGQLVALGRRLEGGQLQAQLGDLVPQGGALLVEGAEDPGQVGLTLQGQVLGVAVGGVELGGDEEADDADRQGDEGPGADRRPGGGPGAAVARLLRRAAAGPAPPGRRVGGRRAREGNGDVGHRPSVQPPKTWRRTAATFWKIRTPKTTATAVARSALSWSPIHTRSTATAALVTKASTNSRSENVCSRWGRRPPKEASMAATTAMAR